MKTSSTLVTPTPTWSTMTVTVTPTKAAALTPDLPSSRKKLLLPSVWPQVEKQPRLTDHRTGLEYADVLEIGRGTSPSVAKTQLDRLKQAYAIFFAQSGNTNNNKNPIFNKDSDLDLGGFDQQGLAAQARSIYVKKASVSQLDKTETIKAEEVVVAPTSTSSYKVFTLYFSGKVPGEYTTRLTTVLVDSQGEPIEESDESESRRKKRYAIQPSKVQHISPTKPPEQINSIDRNYDLDYLMESSENLIESSMSSTTTSVITVTVTETVSPNVC